MLGAHRRFAACRHTGSQAFCGGRTTWNHSHTSFDLARSHYARHPGSIALDATKRSFAVWPTAEAWTTQGAAVRADEHQRSPRMPLSPLAHREARPYTVPGIQSGLRHGALLRPSAPLPLPGFAGHSGLGVQPSIGDQRPTCAHANLETRRTDKAAVKIPAKERHRGTLNLRPLRRNRICPHRHAPEVPSSTQPYEPVRCPAGRCWRPVSKHHAGGDAMRTIEQDLRLRQNPEQFTTTIQPGYS